MRGSLDVRKKKAKKAVFNELERQNGDRHPRNQTSSRGSPDAKTCSKPRSPSREPSTPNGAPAAQRRLPHRPDGCRR